LHFSVGAGSIDHSDEQKRKKIENWVASVNGIHKDKPAATVSYERNMPDIEALMQVGKE
jgi:intraflagellar transport protein 46